MADPPVDAERGATATAAANLVELLPHRPPFLFVNVVDSCVPGKSCMGRYLVTGDEPFLTGHFPGNPVVPGVIQLEALAQVGAVALRAHPDFADRLPLFGGVEKARFRRIVRPGDEMALEIIIDRLSSRGGWGDARATVAGSVVCDARIFFTFATGGRRGERDNPTSVLPAGGSDFRALEPDEHGVGTGGRPTGVAPGAPGREG